MSLTSDDLPLLLNPRDDPGTPSVSREEVEKCSEMISRGQTSLADLVTSMEPLMASGEVKRRKTGMTFLSGVLSSLQRSRMSSSEAHFLARFYTERLSRDSALLQSPSVEGIHALTKSEGLSKEDFCSLLLPFISGDVVHTQSLVPSDRTKIFEILASSFVGERLEEVKKRPDIEDKFLVGFIQAVEGETSPKNLMLIFSLWPTVLRHFKKPEFVEDVFEVLSCYFPVDFTPSKNNPDHVSITRKDLVLGLHSCLSSLPEFAPFAIPLFMEKLASDVAVAKTDSLDCLAMCLPHYSSPDLKPHLGDIWNSCKQEIMGIRTNTNEEVVEKAYKVLGLVTGILGSAVQTPKNREIFTIWTDFVWDDLKSFLRFLESSLMETAVEILATVSEADKAASDRMVDGAVPVLVQVLKKGSSENRERTYEMLAKLLRRARPIRKRCPEWLPSALLAFGEGLDDADSCVREAAAEAILACNGCVAGDAAAGEMLTDAFSRMVKESTTFLSNLDSCSKIAKGALESDTETVRSWARRIASEPFKSEFDLVIASRLCGKDEEILKTIYPGILKSLSEDKDLVSATLDSISTVSSSGANQHYLFMEQNTLQKLVETSVPTQSSAERRSLISKLSSSVKDKSLAAPFRHVMASYVSSIKSDDAVVGDKLDLLEAVLCALHPEILKALEVEVSEAFSRDLTWSNGLVKIRSSILNKLSPEATSGGAEFLDKVLSSKSVPGLEWLVKGLLMRGERRASPELTKRLIDCTLARNDSNVASFLAVVTEDADLTAETNHRVLPFYRQRFFQQTFPVLAERFRLSGEEAALEALLGQLPHVSSSVSEAAMAPLVPGLAKTLFVSGRKMSPAVKEFIGFAMRSGVLEGMTETVVPYLLGVSTAHDVSMSDRILSLEAVAVLADPSSTSSGEKDIREAVISATSRLIDDRKRLVRKAAVEARNKWMA